MEEETPNQRQARLRRERREAKLKAEGSSRLEKITKASGRQNLPPDVPPMQSTTPSSTITGRADPNAVAASSPFSTQPTNGPFQPTEADIRALLRGSALDPGAKDEEARPAEEDPMMKMLSQLMGGMPAADGAEAPPDGLPPGLAALMGGIGGGKGLQTPGRSAPPTYDYVWKIVHAVFAFALGVYVVATSTALSTGPVVRIPGKNLGGEVQKSDDINLFWAFATVELILQSTRYFLERGRTDSGIGGMMGTVSAILPEPWGGYLRLVARYSGIWSTIVEDGCVLIFIVGIVSWWNGAVG